MSQARWRAEREAPHVWGQKQQIEVSTGAGDLSAALEDARRMLRERVVAVVSPDPE